MTLTGVCGSWARQVGLIHRQRGEGGGREGGRREGGDVEREREREDRRVRGGLLEIGGGGMRESG